MPWITSAIEAVTGLGGQYLENKRAERKAESNYRVAKFEAEAQRLAKDADNAHSLDQEAAKERREGYKDEVFFGTILIPIWMLPLEAFGLIKEGTADKMISQLERFPGWYLAAVGLLFVAIFGFRGLLRKYLDMKKISNGLPAFPKANATAAPLSEDEKREPRV